MTTNMNPPDKFNKLKKEFDKITARQATQEYIWKFFESALKEAREVIKWEKRR